MTFFFAEGSDVNVFILLLFARVQPPPPWSGGSVSGADNECRCFLNYAD